MFDKKKLIPGKAKKEAGGDLPEIAWI